MLNQQNKFIYLIIYQFNSAHHAKKQFFLITKISKAKKIKNYFIYLTVLYVKELMCEKISHKIIKNRKKNEITSLIKHKKQSSVSLVKVGPPRT